MPLEKIVRSDYSEIAVYTRFCLSMTKQCGARQLKNQ